MSLSDRYQMFHTSVYAEMYRYLAESLGNGITVEGIKSLGVGFDYKYQAWVIPERNVFGDIIGLSYRYADGRKTMAPLKSIKGAKNRRGLVYPFNQQYDSGEKRYSPGRHNWARVADAGVCCPICNRPDWCIVSAENPSDPQAVLCKRVDEGSVKETEGGFLHIRKRSGRLTAAARLVLPPSDFPVIVVEGASDVLAALSLGLVALGRPNCGACSGLLSKMPLSGREIWVIGEHDSGAGVKGMKETYAVIKHLTPDVRMFLPPKGVKDLRAWVNTGLTVEELVEYAYEHGSTQSDFDVSVFPNAQPATIAATFVEQSGFNGKPTIAILKGKFYRWNGTIYTELDQTGLNKEVTEFMIDKKITVATAQGDVIKPLPTGAKWARDIIFCIPVKAPLALMPGVWLKERQDRPPVDRLISFNNGILDIGEYVESGKVKMYDSDPDLFVLGSLPYAYDPKAECPEYERFILEVQDGDKDALRLLQQWAGYILVPDMSLEKMMMLSGKPRSGKGTILETMRAMLGDDLGTTFKLPDLVNQFGMTDFIGKHLAICGDVRDLRISMQQQAIGNILRVVGGDAISVDRKYHDILTNLHLKIRFMMAMNSLPRFHDDSMALATRTLPIKFNLTWMNREDWSLKSRLVQLAKKGMLINWALRGLRDLRQEHGFVMPQQSQEQLMAIKGMNSSMRAFVNEVCVIGSDKEVQVSLLYKVWRGWCIAQRSRPGSRDSFGRRLFDLVDDLSKRRIRLDNGQRSYAYYGIGINQEELSEYIED